METDFGAFHSVDLPLQEQLYSEYSYFLNTKLDKAVASRKEEFVAGRICASVALSKLGFKLDSLPMGDKREPIWPEGIVGSISHTKGIALALVDKKSSSKSIGIDVEEIIKDDKRKTIERMVAFDKELAFINLFAQKNKAYTVLFSAKEALYKLIYPLAPIYFGFEEARLVALDLETNSFVLELISDKPELQSYKRKYSGLFYEVDNKIISVLRVKA